MDKKETVKEKVIETNINKKWFADTDGKFAKQVLQPFWNTSYYTQASSTYTNEKIQAMQSNPYSSYRQLREVSRYFVYSSAYYTNILNYLATTMTFDYYIYPTILTDNDKRALNKLEKSAFIVKQTNVKQLFPHMLYRTLIEGETFWYDDSDGESILIREINNGMCKVAMIDDNNLYRYMINLSKITKNTLPSFPEEIQVAYNKYTASDKTKKGEKRIMEGMEMPINYYLVSASGFAMLAHRDLREHDYPYLANMLDDINTYEEDKTYYNNYIKADNIKLIHGRMPMDKETGLPVMDYDDMEKYNNSLKSNTPDNVGSVITPFDVTAVNLDKAQQQGINVLEQSKTNIEDGSGVSSTLFGADTSTGLKYSVLVDAAKMYPFLSYFTDFINYKIKKYDMQIKFLEVCQYDKKEQLNNASSGMSTAGDIRFKYIALSGSEIYDFLMTARLEQKINIDELMPVKESAFQSSGDAGRPTSDEPSETTEKNRENN